MNYISEKGGEIHGGILAALEYGHYVDCDELIDLQWWLAKALGLDEGPIDVCGEMECPIYLTDGGDWMVWTATFGWRKLESLFGQWKREAEEWRKEFEE